jgi:transcriptional regulator with XRE-family HTH domain
MVAVAKKKEIDPEFGQQLRVLRLRAGLTLEALAERVGMAYTAIARLERSEREPTWTTIKRLAEGLEVGLEAFSVNRTSSNDGPDARPMGKRK